MILNLFIDQNNHKTNITMKRVLNPGSLLLILMFFAAGCGKDPKIEHVYYGENKGGFSLKLGTLGSFEVVTKAADVAVEDFTVRIKGTTLKGTAYDSTWVRYGDMPSVVTIPAGTYKIEAYNGEQRSGFESPFYYGSKDFMVGIQELTDAQVTCQLACVKVSVAFTPLFLSNVSDAVCIVHQVNGAALEFDSEEDQGTGYIASPADSVLAVTVRGKYVEDGSEVNRTYFIKSVGSKQWHKIELSVNTSAGIENGGGMIQVDHRVDEKESSVLVPGAGDLIDNNGDSGSWGDGDGDGDGGGDNPGDGGQLPEIVGISLNGVAFNIDEPIVLNDEHAAGATVDVELNAPEGGIQQLLLVMTSQDDVLGGIFAAIGGSDPLHPMDLANPGDLSNPAEESWQYMLKTVGLMNPDAPIKGKTQHIFSVGAFMGLLTSPGEGFYEHSFAIKIVDGNGNEVSKNLVVKRCME